MQRFFAGNIEPLGDREVGVIAGTSQRARDGHIIDMAGMDLSGYRKNPIVLWQHDPGVPVGVCHAIAVTGGTLVGRIEFAPAAASLAADQTCSLVKAGVVQGVSIGFDPIEAEPLDPKRPRDGLHITRAELLEISFVSIPADTGAGVVTCSLSGRPAGFFDALSPVPRAAIERAAARLPRLGAGGGIVSHSSHVWLLQEQRRREREAFPTLAERRREAEELRRKII